MFGPYKINHNGCTYHGNVALKQYHISKRDDSHCLLRIEDMTALPISETLAEAIVRMIPSPGTLIPDVLIQALRDCGLVAENKLTAEPPATLAKPVVRPVVKLCLFLTQTCNMRCVYCYGNGGEYGKAGMMTRETALAAVDWLMENSFDAKVVEISFFGGEPLMNFSLLQQVVAYAKTQAEAWNKEVNFSMTTNGTLLTNPVITFLKEEKIDLLISFDGPSEIQNRQRPFKNGRGSYKRVYANVQKLRFVFPNLAVRATIHGKSDLFTIQKELKAAGFATCHLSMANPVLPWGKTTPGKDTEVHQASAGQMLAYLREEVKHLFSAIKNRRLDTTITPGVKILLAGLVDGRKRHGSCGVGRGLRAVSIDGGVYPCHRFVGREDTRLGHIQNYRAGEINDYHRAAVENLPVCRACWARYFCGGGCFYNNQASTGDMHRPDPLLCHEIKTVCEDLIHGWCLLDESDKAWLRGQVEKLDPGLRV